MSRKILVDLLYVEWGSKHRQKSLREAFRCISLAGATTNHLIIADNKLDCDKLKRSPARRTAIIRGNNLAREFSGWDEAYAELGRNAQSNGASGPHARPADVLLFVNDTFGAHRRIRIARRIQIARWLRLVAKSPRLEMFGPIDPYGEVPAHWMFGPISRYVSSYLFGMSPGAAKLLFPLCQIDAQIDTMLAREYSPDGLFTDQLPREMCDKLNDWLFVPGRWRNAAPLTPENFAFFQLKAKSVLYEYALTCRAEAAGILVSDIFTGRGTVDSLIGNMGREWLDFTARTRHNLLNAFKSALR